MGVVLCNSIVYSGCRATGTQGYQGSSVSISSDGNTAIVGGYTDNSNIGAAWVYTRSGGVWTQQGSKLVGTGAIGTHVYQGSSVSISSDGNTAIVGGNGDNNTFGAVWVYARSGGVWTQQGNKLVGTGNTGVQVNQGYSVSIASDGNTAIVGGIGDNGFIGAAWVFSSTIPTISVNGKNLTSSSATGNQWYLDGVIIPGATLQTYTVTQNGNYTVKVTDGSGGSSISAPQNISSFVTTDISEYNLETINIYPNPTGGIINVNKGQLENVQVNIYNVLGESIYQFSITSSNYQIDLTAQPNGVYFVQLRTEQGIMNKKLIIQK